jgi:hypothetical protein
MFLEPIAIPLILELLGFPAEACTTRVNDDTFFEVGLDIDRLLPDTCVEEIDQFFYESNIVASSCSV